MLLADLPDGTEARVLAFSGEPGPYARKLLAMGLVPGARLQIVRRAPLGDPVQISVLGYHLSLRASEAAGLRVEVV
jgi:ferrous iron transport protein A